MYEVANPAVFEKEPELGMGYQFGVSDGKQGLIVLNAQYALEPQDVASIDSMRQLLQLSRGDKALPPLEKLSIVLSNDIGLFEKCFGHLVSDLRSYQTRRKLHASPAFPLQTSSPEKFVRFSAFQNDRRMQSDGSVLSGTYVTSDRDAAIAPSGFAVVGRYALPNPAAAIHRFDITVPQGTPGLVGTVAPAFAQAGGGVEIELTSGAPAGSLGNRSTIPEY